MFCTGFFRYCDKCLTSHLIWLNIFDRHFITSSSYYFQNSAWRMSDPGAFSSFVSSADLRTSLTGPVSASITGVSVLSSWIANILLSHQSQGRRTILWCELEHLVNSKTRTNKDTEEVYNNLGDIPCKRNINKKRCLKCTTSVGVCHPGCYNHVSSFLDICLSRYVIHVAINFLRGFVCCSIGIEDVDAVW